MMVTFLKEIADSTTVRNYQSIVLPFIAKDLTQQARVTTTWLTIKPLIGTHHFTYIAYRCERFECRKIGLPQIALRQIFKIEDMTVPFRTRVDGEMLDARKGLIIMWLLSQRFQVLLPRLSLKSIDNRNTHSARQIRILTIGFHATSPTRVAENIDIRCPYTHTLVPTDITTIACHVSLCHCLSADYCKNLIKQSIIKRSCHACVFRKDRGKTIAGNTMQTLAPPFKLRNTQPGNGRRTIAH